MQGSVRLVEIAVPLRLQVRPIPVVALLGLTPRVVQILPPWATVTQRAGVLRGEGTDCGHPKVPPLSFV